MQRKERLYSLAHLTMIECSVPELVYIAARAGYDCVSARFIPIDQAQPVFSADKAQAQATRVALKSTGIQLHDIEIARITEDYAPQALEPALALGCELGAKCLLASAWTQRQDDKNFLVDRYAQTCQLAAKYGLTVDLEFPSFSRVRTFAEALDIVLLAGQPNGGILIDTMYIHHSQTDIQEIGSAPADLFHMMQISDTAQQTVATDEQLQYLARNHRLHVGEGCIDFHAIAQQLPILNCAIEIPNTRRIQKLGYEEYARRCLQHAKKTLQPTTENMA